MKYCVYRNQKFQAWKQKVHKRLKEITLKFYSLNHISQEDE